MTLHLRSATRAEAGVHVLPAKPGDAPAILDLVCTVNLPQDGIEEALEYFWVAQERNTIIGSVGIEVYGEHALLRSLAVTPPRQHAGLGGALVDTVLAYLSARQFQSVYLLTTTAEAFFTRYGFRTIERADVPPRVQQSVEFRSACPATATCMARHFTYTALPAPPGRQVRAARFADLPSIQAIHNQGIADRLATLDTEPRSLEETRHWLQRHGPRHPVLVVEVDGIIAAWASLNTFNPRRAYQYVADLSVYVDRQWRGHGLGTTLLQAIVPVARDLSYHKIVLSAFPHNTAGLRLYERQGFTTVGVYREMGRVDGQWMDTIIMEKLLNNV